MRRCKLITTGDVAYQYLDGVGPSPKAGAVVAAGSALCKSAIGAARLITAEGEYRGVADHEYAKNFPYCLLLLLSISVFFTF